MSTINNLYSGGYYSLTGSKTNHIANSNGKATTLTDTLAQSSSMGSAFSLDLSDEAKNYLAQLNTISQTGFTLTREQTDTLTDIVNTYKDEPFTQDSFNKLQDELASAGLSPERLSALENAKTFNPTDVLMKALNGDFSDSTVQNQGNSEEKTNQFMNSIIARWKAVSTTAGDAAAPVTSS